MQDLQKQLAKNLRKMRGETNQRQFARKIGVSVATLSRMESGIQNVTVTTLQKLCVRLKVPVATLFED